MSSLYASSSSNTIVRMACYNRFYKSAMDGYSLILPLVAVWNRRVCELRYLDIVKTKFIADAGCFAPDEEDEVMVVKSSEYIPAYDIKENNTKKETGSQGIRSEIARKSARLTH